MVNSSVGPNCCTCNCQSTLQAILQELKTMRKLMQLQAGTVTSPTCAYLWQAWGLRMAQLVAGVLDEMVFGGPFQTQTVL